MRLTSMRQRRVLELQSADSQRDDAAPKGRGADDPCPSAVVWLRERPLHSRPRLEFRIYPVGGSAAGAPFLDAGPLEVRECLGKPDHDRVCARTHTAAI